METTATNNVNNVNTANTASVESRLQSAEAAYNAAKSKAAKATAKAEAAEAAYEKAAEKSDATEKAAKTLLASLEAKVKKARSAKGKEAAEAALKDEAAKQRFAIEAAEAAKAEAAKAHKEAAEAWQIAADAEQIAFNAYNALKAEAEAAKAEAEAEAAKAEAAQIAGIAKNLFVGIYKDTTKKGLYCPASLPSICGRIVVRYTANNGNNSYLIFGSEYLKAAITPANLEGGDAATIRQNNALLAIKELFLLFAAAEQVCTDAPLTITVNHGADEAKKTLFTVNPLCSFLGATELTVYDASGYEAAFLKCDEGLTFRKTLLANKQVLTDVWNIATTRKKSLKGCLHNVARKFRVEVRLLTNIKAAYATMLAKSGVTSATTEAAKAETKTA